MDLSGCSALRLSALVVEPLAGTRGRRTESLRPGKNEDEDEDEGKDEDEDKNDDEDEN